MTQTNAVAAARAAARPPARSGFRQRGWLDGYLLLLPAVVIYGLFVVVPVFQSLLLSFQAWDGFSPARRWIGLANYAEILQSDRFWMAFANNVIWAVLSAAPVFLGLLLAAILFQGRIVGSTVFRVAFLLPFTLSNVITGIVWTWIYQPEWGVVNTLLRLVGLDRLATAWLSEPGTALIAMNIVGGWTWFGFCMVIFLAGLQAIPQDIYDAARIDGASARQAFFRITIPLLRRQIQMVSIVTVIFSFKVFDTVYVMTRGGPFQTSEVLGLLIYITGFEQYDIGYASAIAIVLTTLVFAVSLLTVRTRE